MTTLIAWRNLLQDPLRFGATVIGIVFAVVLISMQTGMLLGFVQTTAGLVEKARADIWIAAQGTTNVDQSGIVSESAYYRAIGVQGVESVGRTNIQFTGWKKPDGGTETIIIVGFDPISGMAGPWNIVEGSIDDLSSPNAVMLDRLYADKLGVSKIGDRIEIADRSAVVVGFTSGIRTFTQSPYVFTTYANSLRYLNLKDGEASYMLVKASAGTDHRALARDLETVMGSDLDIMPEADFAARTRDYWILTTGAGSALVMGAVLGALVGIIIVAQTLYSATVERLSEYATLNAIGAGNGYLNAIVIKQSIIAGGIGFAIAAIIASALAWSSTSSPAAILLPFGALLTIGVLTQVMCVLASLLAIRKLYTIDPTSVFR